MRERRSQEESVRLRRRLRGTSFPKGSQGEFSAFGKEGGKEGRAVNLHLAAEERFPLFVYANLGKLIMAVPKPLKAGIKEREGFRSAGGGGGKRIIDIDLSK